MASRCCSQKKSWPYQTDISIPRGSESRPNPSSCWLDIQYTVTTHHTTFFWTFHLHFSVQGEFSFVRWNATSSPDISSCQKSQKIWSIFSFSPPRIIDSHFIHMKWEASRKVSNPLAPAFFPEKLLKKLPEQNNGVAHLQFLRERKLWNFHDKYSLSASQN